MKNTFLVQRLNKKPKSEFHAKMSQVFGGGMIMMNQEGWKAIQSVCDLHYMGAAEYEFGTIPKCLESLAKDHEKLTTFPLLIKREIIKPNWNHENAHRRARQAELAKAKKEGVRPLQDAAKDVVRKILKEHQPMPLDRDVEKELSKVVKDAEKTIGQFLGDGIKVRRFARFVLGESA